jgi:hypothetical protein
MGHNVNGIQLVPKIRREKSRRDVVCGAKPQILDLRKSRREDISSIDKGKRLQDVAIGK